MNKSNNPTLITIGITCFNAAETIERAILSAIKQDWPNKEILIVDDVSTDDSASVIGAAINQQPGVRFIRHRENTGPAGARNTIVNEAKGEIIVFFDDDDESLPERISTQFNKIIDYERKNNVDLVACYASGVRRYANGYELEMPAIGSKPGIPVGAYVADYLLYNGRKENIYYGSGVPTCALMARLSTIRAVGGFDNNLRRVEDVDLAIRLALAGGHFIGCPEKLFMQYATVASDKTPLKNLESELYLVDKYSKYLRTKHRHLYAKQWFRIRYYHFSEQRTKFITMLIIFLLCYPVSGIKHLMRSLSGRWSHERKMNA